MSAHRARYTRQLPLVITENDGLCHIRCSAANDCVWSWHLVSGSAESNGRAIDSAIKHVYEKHDTIAAACDTITKASS